MNFSNSPSVIPLLRFGHWLKNYVVITVSPRFSSDLILEKAYQNTTIKLELVAAEIFKMCEFLGSSSTNMFYKTYYTDLSITDSNQ